MSVATLGGVQKYYYVSLFLYRNFNYSSRNLMFLDTHLEILYLQLCLPDVQGQVGKGETLSSLKPTVKS